MWIYRATTLESCAGQCIVLCYFLYVVLSSLKPCTVYTVQHTVTCSELASRQG